MLTTGCLAHRAIRMADTEESDREVVHAPDVVAEDVAPTQRVADLVPEFLDRLDIASGVVGMRKVGRPEEAIAAAEIDHRGQRLLVGISGHPDVAPEIKARLFLERHAAAHHAV